MASNMISGDGLENLRDVLTKNINLKSLDVYILYIYIYIYE